MPAIPATATPIDMADQLSLVALLQLASPSLPTGAFSYSQGLEWAVEQGWIHDGESLSSWLHDSLYGPMAYTDLPLLHRMRNTMEQQDNSTLRYWCAFTLACRETFELREEELQRGKAMYSLLKGLSLVPSWIDANLLEQSQLAGFACGAHQWHIDPQTAAAGYCWSWLENQVLAGIKIIPLGQTEGQQILARLRAHIPLVLQIANQTTDGSVGSASPALALASSFHETQYTRLYRS